MQQDPHHSGLCYCPEGFCAGGYGCFQTNYIEEPRVHKIRNARWPDYVLAVQTNGKLIVTSDDTTDASSFTIVTPPSSGQGHCDALPDFKRVTLNCPYQVQRPYLLYSVLYPDSACYAAQKRYAFGHWMHCAVCGSIKGVNKATPHGLLEDEITGPIELPCGDVGQDPPLESVSMQFTKVSARNETFIMLSTGILGYIYAPSGSTGEVNVLPNATPYNIRGQLASISGCELTRRDWSDPSTQGRYPDNCRLDPGAGGYWSFEPPLPDQIAAELPTYTGFGDSSQRCEWDCDGWGEEDASYVLAWSPLLLILVHALHVHFL